MHQEAVGDLGGYRTIRRLSLNDRAENVLAVSEVGSVRTSVVIKRFFGPDAAERSTRAASALWRARGRHVMRMLDAINIGDSNALVVEFLPIPVSRVIASNSALQAGHLVTILTPLIGTLSAMHAAGVTHGALGPSAVRLDRRGAPVLIGFEEASLFPPRASRAELARQQAVVRDVAALHSLVNHFMVQFGLPVPVLQAALESQRDLSLIESDPGNYLAGLEHTVFQIADPLPLPLRNESPKGTPDGPGARGEMRLPPESNAWGFSAAINAPSHPKKPDVGRLQGPSPDTRSGARQGRRSPAGDRLLNMLNGIGERAVVWFEGRMPDWLAATPKLLRTGGAPGRRSVTPAKRAAKVRARVWVPATLTVATGLIVALMVSVSPVGDSLASGADRPSQSETIAPTDPIGNQVMYDERLNAGEQSGVEDVSAGESADGRASGADLTRTETDSHQRLAASAEAAGVALVNERARCLRALSLACVLNVVQADSPAESADRFALASVSDNPPRGYDWVSQVATVVDEFGAAALVEVTVLSGQDTFRVPILLVKTGTGWRIRAVLD